MVPFDEDHTLWTPFAITLRYLVFGSVWIVLTDWAVTALLGASAQTARVQLLKGLLFVAGSTLFIYFTVDRRHRRIRQREATIRKDRHEIEELQSEVAESERLLRVVLDNIRETVLLTDDDGRFTYVSPSVRHVFGYTADAVAAMGNVDALLGEEFRSDPLEGTDRIENLEREVVDADGDSHTVLVTVTPVSVGAGTRLYSVRDISERKAQEEQFQAYVENSSDVITVVDEEGIVEYVSPAAEHVFGYEPEELIGRNPFELIHPDDHQQVQEAFEAVGVEPPGTTVSAEYRTRHADGSWVWTESRLTVHGEPVGGEFVINSRDVSDLREREGRISVLDRVLRHNIRNKLNVILGQAKGIDVGSDPGLRSKVDSIVDAGESLLELSEKARRFDAISRRGDDQPGGIELVDRIRGAVDQVRAEHPNADVRTSLPAEAWVRAHEAIELSLVELLENAVVHAGREDPTVEVDVVVHESAVELRVADDGQGIPEVDRQVVVEGEESPLEHGLGLGLWLVRWTVENSGGTLDVSEHEPTGTMIEIRLPRSTPNETATPEAGG